MKLVSLLVGAVLAGVLGAAVALAAPPPDRPQPPPPPPQATDHGPPATTPAPPQPAPPTTGRGPDQKPPTPQGPPKPPTPSKATNRPPCHPQIVLVITGFATAAGSRTSVSLKLTGGNDYAKLLFGKRPNVTTTVNTGPQTEVITRGRAGSLASVRKGDRMLVQYQICKGNLAGSTPAAVAASLGKNAAWRVVDLGTAARPAAG
jgi:hypothetical protein